jgi:hypothetical protein
MASPGAKKPFVEPELVVYGTLQAITQSVGKAGKLDGGKGASMNKTS